MLLLLINGTRFVGAAPCSIVSESSGMKFSCHDYLSIDKTIGYSGTRTFYFTIFYITKMSFVPFECIQFVSSRASLCRIGILFLTSLPCCIRPNCQEFASYIGPKSQGRLCVRVFLFFAHMKYDRRQCVRPNTRIHYPYKMDTEAYVKNNLWKAKRVIITVTGAGLFCDRLVYDIFPTLPFLFY